MAQQIDSASALPSSVTLWAIKNDPAGLQGGNIVTPAYICLSEINNQFHMD